MTTQRQVVLRSAVALGSSSKEKAMAQAPLFEFPPDLRELAEKNIQQARAAYGQFMDAMAQAMGAWTGAMPPNQMTSGFKSVQDRAIQFAKQNAEAGFTLASELANAKDISEVMEIQSRYAQTQFETYAR
jgi:hypothetical protein